VLNKGKSYDCIITWAVLRQVQYWGWHHIDIYSLAHTYGNWWSNFKTLQLVGIKWTDAGASSITKLHLGDNTRLQQDESSFGFTAGWYCYPLCRGYCELPCKVELYRQWNCFYLDCRVIVHNPVENVTSETLKESKGLLALR